MQILCFTIPYILEEDVSTRNYHGNIRKNNNIQWWERRDLMGLGGQLCHKKYLGMDAMSSKSQLLEETSRHILKKELSRFQQRRKLKRRSANCTHKSNYQRI